MASYRKVAFLDTNALHFVDLYLREAGERKLFPFGGGEAEAYSHLDGSTEGKPREALTKGLNAVAYLLRGGVRVEYSVIAELEMMAGRARGRALERAAAEGIPERMWTRFSENETSGRLLTHDLIQIRHSVEKIGPTLEAAGIDASVADASRTRDALELAKDVAAAVYMSMADCVIYASALVAEADELLSADHYLRKTVNRLKDNSMQDTRQQLQRRVAAIRSGPLRPLPAARKIPKRKL